MTNYELAVHFGLEYDRYTPMPLEIPNVNREDLAKWFSEWGFKIGVEVGVYGGGYSEMLCKSNPELVLYCVDPWEAYQGMKIRQQQLDAIYEEAKDRLRQYNCTIIKKDSVKASQEIQSEIDFVYIDGNHTLPYVIRDLYAWTPKVKNGGIISGHDYVRFKGRLPDLQVVEAVNAFTSANAIRPWFVLGKKVRRGSRDVLCRSWMWAKE